MGPAQEAGTTFRKIKKKTKEKSQAAAASEAQLWHGKRQVPAAYANSEHGGGRGPGAGGHSRTAVRTEPSDHCRPSTSLLQPTPSRPSSSMPARVPSSAIPPFLQGLTPSQPFKPLSKASNPQMAVVLLSPYRKANVSHRLAFPRSSLCSPPL